MASSFALLAMKIGDKGLKNWEEGLKMIDNDGYLIVIWSLHRYSLSERNCGKGQLAQTATGVGVEIIFCTVVYKFTS